MLVCGFAGYSVGHPLLFLRSLRGRAASRCPDPRLGVSPKRSALD